MTRNARIGASLAVLVALLAFVYHGAGDAAFINWDDDVYVYANPHVSAGVTAAGWRWAWSFDTPPYLIPATWLSFMLNAELSGIDPGAYHLTNVALHAASVLLLFALFLSMTGELLRSLLVAALFAIHPLHVEGVMWVAQRKEVLSAFFGIVALHCYLRYVRCADGDRGNAAREWYLMLLFALLISLLSKPMWLTMPALLLLLDAWPLQRQRVGLRQLIAEKLPVGALCVVVFALNILAFDWSAAQLAKSIDVTPFAAGWQTIPVSYAVFLWKTFVPYPLAVPYTNFAAPPGLVPTAAAVAVLVVVSAVAVRIHRTSPWITVGWFWFLIAAATVLFSFGSGKVTPLADHWTYVPHIGLFAAIAWSLPLARPHRRAVRVGTAAASVLVAATLAVIAQGQTRHWRDAPSLWAHSIEVTENNHVAHWLWGLDEWNAGRQASGERLMRAAHQLIPDEPFYVQSLGNLMLAAGRHDEALAQYRRLMEPPLANPDILTTVGVRALRNVGASAAMPFLRHALMLAENGADGDAKPARFYLWLALVREDRDAEAQELLQDILAESAVDRRTFCTEAADLIRRLGRLDPDWNRFVASIDSRCRP